MRNAPSFLSKVFALGPWPYFSLAIAILIVGAVLQISSGTVDNLGEGQTIFGIFCKIGGAVALFGLIPLAVDVEVAHQTSAPNQYAASSRLPKIPAQASTKAEAVANPEERARSGGKRRFGLSPGKATKLVRMAMRDRRSVF